MPIRTSPIAARGRTRVLLRGAIAAALGALVLAAPGTARADFAPKPSLLAQLRGGGRIIACRNAATALVQPASRNGERVLSSAGRAQAQRLGNGIRGQAIPVGPVLAAPGAATVESARLAFGTASRQAPALAGTDAATARLFRDGVAAGSNRVLVASEAVLRRMLPHHGRAPIAEGDCLVLRPERLGRPHIQARLAPDDWAQLRDVPHVPQP